TKNLSEVWRLLHRCVAPVRLEIPRKACERLEETVMRSKGIAESKAINAIWRFTYDGHLCSAFLTVFMLANLPIAEASVGRPVWAVDGVAVSTASGGQGVGFAGKPGITMIPDGGGGVFIAWEDIESASVFVQRFNAAGLPLWGVNSIDVTLAQGFKFS